MTFADLLAGESVFLDANTLVYLFGLHPVFGPTCRQFLHHRDSHFGRSLTDKLLSS
jgi:hypothetical protein